MKVERYVDDYFEAMDRVNPLLPRNVILQVVERLYQAWKDDATIFLAGNGGSASTATHFASDLSKFSIPPGRKGLRAMSLVDNIPLVSALENDEGHGTIFSEQLKTWMKEGDVLIAISVHGGSGTGNAGPWSQNLGRAVEVAKARGATVIGFSGFDGGMLGKESDLCITIPITTEPLGTPLVEAYHVVLHHLIAAGLKLRIEAGREGRVSSKPVGAARR